MPHSDKAELTRPPAAPTDIATIIAKGIETDGGKSVCSTKPPHAADSAARDPIEISIPPTMITIAAANPRIIQVAEASNSTEI